jgi:single-stranded DNA-binding protein
MEPPYTNRVWLQGRIFSTPTRKALNARTSITSFMLAMVESWDNASGETRERKNRVMVEVVGRDSKRVADEAKLGSWVTLEGYIRSELFKGQELVKVRTLVVNVWEGPDELPGKAVEDH